MQEFFKLRDFNLRNKTIALRVDFNLPYNLETGELAENSRLWKHTETIKELVNKKAKIIVLAHQGRKGKPDFISLKKHAELLEKNLDKKVRFLKYGESFNEIKKLESGEVMLLDNVRFYEDEIEKKSIEEHANSMLPKKLTPLIDYFVLDAFSVAHRSHASVVGFSVLKPCIAGPVFELELEKLKEFSEKIKSSKTTFILGGAKPEEPLKLIENFVGPHSEILTTGVISLLFLTAKGYNLGKTEEFLKENGYLSNLQRIKKILGEYENKIKVPVDLAIERHTSSLDSASVSSGNEASFASQMNTNFLFRKKELVKRVEISLNELPVEERILDIGKKTLENYEKIISSSDVICMKGPAGVYENKNFESGTKKLFEILKKHKCTLVGGGNTIDALERFKIPFNNFSYVSLGGGAFVEYLTGKELPGIEALKLSFERFRKNIF